MMMAQFLKQTPGCIRALSKTFNSTSSRIHSALLCQSHRRVMSSDGWQGDFDPHTDKAPIHRHEREYSPSERYTSTPMQDEEGLGADRKEQTFGLLSGRFKHKYEPLGDDVIAELEDAELGEEWVRPRVQRNTPIWYGNQMKKLVKEGKVAEAIEMLEVTMLKEANIFPTDFNYNVLIGACGRAGYTDKAFKLYNRMKERGLEPSSTTYTALFNACSESPWPKTDGLTRLKKLHRQLLEKSIKINLITHHSMMKAYGKCGDLEMTFKLFRHLLDSRVQLMPKTFSFLLFACVEDKETGFLYAVEAWRQMLAQGIKPDIFIYNLLLRATRDCSIGDMATANRVLLRPVQPRCDRSLERADDAGAGKKVGRRKVSQRTKLAIPLLGKKAEMVLVEPIQVDDELDERFTHGAPDLPTVDHALDKPFEHVTHCDKTASRDYTHNPSHNETSYLTLSDGDHSWDAHDQVAKIPMEPKTPKSPESTLDILNVRLSNSAEVQHNVIPSSGASPAPNLLDISSDFSKVQSLAAVNHSSHRVALLGGAKGVLDSMLEHSVQPDVKSLSILAEILPAKKQDEDQVLQFVAEGNVKVDIDFYNVFIRRRTWRRDLEAAKAVLSHVREQKLYPNLRTYVNLATGCILPEDGFQLLKEMEEAGLEPTCHVYGALIAAAKWQQNFEYLVDILKDMEKRGAIPNERVIGQLENIAGFGQDKVAEARRKNRPIKKRELNRFRGFYNQWLARMTVEVPQHPWSRLETKEGDTSKVKFHETAI